MLVTLVIVYTLYFYNMRYKLYKLAELPDAFYPNNIPEGYVCEGEMYSKLAVGSYAIVGTMITSLIVEMIDEKTFRTQNSIYRIQPVGEIPKPKPFLKFQYTE